MNHKIIFVLFILISSTATQAKSNKLKGPNEPSNRGLEFRPEEGDKDEGSAKNSKNHIVRIGGGIEALYPIQIKRTKPVQNNSLSEPDPAQVSLP